MNEVYEFLNKCETYYLATMDGNEPKVRPFGTVALYKGKLYIQTGKSKSVSKQMLSNPRVEICAFDGDTWLRLAATAVNDDDIKAKEFMLEKYPMLKGMYKADDGNTQVLYLTDAVAVFNSFSKPPKTIKF